MYAKEFHPMPYSLNHNEVDTPEYSFHDVHEPIKVLLLDEEEVL